MEIDVVGDLSERERGQISIWMKSGSGMLSKVFPKQNF